MFGCVREKEWVLGEKVWKTNLKERESVEMYRKCKN